MYRDRRRWRKQKYSAFIGGKNPSTQEHVLLLRKSWGSPVTACSRKWGCPIRHLPHHRNLHHFTQVCPLARSNICFLSLPQGSGFFTARDPLGLWAHFNKAHMETTSSIYCPQLGHVAQLLSPSPPSSEKPFLRKAYKLQCLLTHLVESIYYNVKMGIFYIVSVLQPKIDLLYTTNFIVKVRVITCIKAGWINPCLTRWWKWALYLQEYVFLSRIIFQHK